MHILKLKPTQLEAVALCGTGHEELVKLISTPSLENVSKLCRHEHWAEALPTTVMYSTWSKSTPLKDKVKLYGNLEEWGWFVGCLTSQQQASVSQGGICSDNFTCCHVEKEVAEQTFYLTQSQYADTWPTSADPITPGIWQDSHWSANF